MTWSLILMWTCLFMVGDHLSEVCVKKSSCIIRISKHEIRSAWLRFMHDATSWWTCIPQAAWYRQAWNSAGMRSYWNSFPSTNIVLPTRNFHVFQLSSTKWKPHVHVNNQLSTPFGGSGEGKGKRKRQREERLRVANEDSSGGKFIDIMVFSACHMVLVGQRYVGNRWN